MRRKGRIGIQALLLRVFLPVVVLAALLLAAIVYNRVNATILRQFDGRLVATSALTGALIDPADHDWLIGEAMGPEAAAVAAERDVRYRRNVEPMQRIRQRLELTYIYTQVTSGSAEVRYVLDGTEGEEHTPLGSPDSLPPDTMAGLRDVQARNGIYVSPVEYQEKWGLLKTAAAPVYDARGRIRGTAGADVNVSVIRVATQNALFLSAMIGLASLLACLLVTLQIVRRVARPIERLTQEALRIAAGDHRPPAAVGSPREVASLRKSLAQLNDHVTGELEQAVAAAAQHRLSASEQSLLDSEGASAAVTLFDVPGQQAIWLPVGQGGIEEALAARAMLRLRDRIAGRPQLAERIAMLADLDRGILVIVDPPSRRLTLTGPEPLAFETDDGSLRIVPDEETVLPRGATWLRHRGATIMLSTGGAR